MAVILNDVRMNQRNDQTIITVIGVNGRRVLGHAQHSDIGESHYIHNKLIIIHSYLYSDQR